MIEPKEKILFEKYEKCKFFMVGFDGPESKHFKTYLYEKRFKNVSEEKEAESAWKKVELASFHFILINLDAAHNDDLLERLVESNRFTKTPIFSFSKAAEVYRNSYANRKMTGRFLDMPINLAEFEKEFMAILKQGEVECNQVSGMSQTLVHYTHGCKAYLKNDLETAKEQIRLCLKEDPNYVDGYTKMGEILIDMEDFSAAYRVLQRGVQLAPDNLKALYLIGIIQLRGNNNEAAEKAFKKGMELEPGNVQYITDVGNVYLKHNMLDSALCFFNHAKTKAPAFLYIYNRIGIALSRAGRFDEAESEYQKAVKIDDKDAGVYFNMGMLELRRNNKEKAADHFKKTLLIDSELTEARQMLEKISA